MVSRYPCVLISVAVAIYGNTNHSAELHPNWLVTICTQFHIMGLSNCKSRSIHFLSQRPWEILFAYKLCRCSTEKIDVWLSVNATTVFHLFATTFCNMLCRSQSIILQFNHFWTTVKQFDHVILYFYSSHLSYFNLCKRFSMTT